MKIEIKHSNGKWTVNGKSFDKLNTEEKKFMDGFFKEVKVLKDMPVNNQGIDPKIKQYGIYSLR